MKYKVGDRVKIKSLDWYNRRTNGTEIVCGEYPFTSDMKVFCGQERIIANVCQECYILLGIDDKFVFTDEMIEGLVEDENNHLTEVVVDAVRESNDRYRIVVDPRFDIEVDEGEYYVVRRKKEYPKTYEECCEVLGHVTIDEVRGYKATLLDNLQMLLVCRDAYWKIAGEEMGLGKPWEPDFDNLSTNLEYIKIVKGCFTYSNRAFAFPIPEMRDAFKENFKELIEECKDFL